MKGEHVIEEEWGENENIFEYIEVSIVTWVKNDIYFSIIK